MVSQAAAGRNPWIDLSKYPRIYQKYHVRQWIQGSSYKLILKHCDSTWMYDHFSTSNLELMELRNIGWAKNHHTVPLEAKICLINFFIPFCQKSSSENVHYHRALQRTNKKTFTNERSLCNKWNFLLCSFFLFNQEFPNEFTQKKKKCIARCILQQNVPLYRKDERQMLVGWLEQESLFDQLWF